MANSLGLLTRLFKRSSSPLVAQVFTHAIGKPLLVHPSMGEALVGAYLHGAIEARPSTLTIGEFAPGKPGTEGQPDTPPRRVGVLNVSGGLVNRFEPGLCDPGPLSYVELRAAFDAAMADSSIEAIVLRLETPGGMASGLFDLADHIAASRGGKPIYAVIDDYAYSAGYALAAAADEIWITRTGGAGSVGVRAFHVDQSAWNAKQGLKVTEITAGEHKADFSPHAPLSEGAMTRLQAEIDELRELFVASVASYRSMDPAAVMATEALCYSGQAAIDIGFADRLGTYSELMASLPRLLEERVTVIEEPEEEEEEAAKAATVVLTEEDAAALIATSAARGLVADMIADADLHPSITKALLRRKDLDADAAEAAITDARAIDDACAAAGLRDCAPAYVEKGMSIEKVRAELAAVVADPGPEISTHLPVPGAEKPAAASRLSPSAIYLKRGN